MWITKRGKGENSENNNGIQNNEEEKI